MRRIWSELNRRRLWRRVWVTLAQAEQAAGLVAAEQVADLKAHSQHIDLERALAQHPVAQAAGLDVARAIAALAEPPALRPPDRAGRPGGLLHLDREIPTVVVPDIHGRRELLLRGGGDAARVGAASSPGSRWRRACSRPDST